MDDASTLAKDLLGVTLVPETTVQSAPDVTSSPPVDQERGGSESLARTTWSAGFQPRHTTGVVLDPVPNPDYYHKVLGGDETGTVARGLPVGLPTG
jgi:hypothetical protein